MVILSGVHCTGNVELVQFLTHMMSQQPQVVWEFRLDFTLYRIMVVVAREGAKNVSQETGLYLLPVSVLSAKLLW